MRNAAPSVKNASPSRIGIHASALPIDRNSLSMYSVSFSAAMRM